MQPYEQLAMSRSVIKMLCALKYSNNAHALFSHCIPGFI